MFQHLSSTFKYLNMNSSWVKLKKKSLLSRNIYKKSSPQKMLFSHFPIFFFFFNTPDIKDIITPVNRKTIHFVVPTGNHIKIWITIARYFWLQKYWMLNLQCIISFFFKNVFTIDLLKSTWHLFTQWMLQNSIFMIFQKEWIKFENVTLVQENE